ncbi:MAG: arsenate reductase ArsC [Phycisphaera sp.]|nr:arsenate reductase ArsC [Phycisphaera sp.]
MDHTDKLRLLVLCTANRCRSQMAEGWLRHLGGKHVEVHSAGVKPSVVHPLAVKVMKEVSIDLTDHRSKHVEEYLGQDFDCVVTVCDSARETCPVLPGAKRTVHHSFPDPDKATGDESQVLEVFRDVRDQIGRWAEGFLQGVCG